jgi:hypothetical protein
VTASPLERYFLIPLKLAQGASHSRLETRSRLENSRVVDSAHRIAAPPSEATTKPVQSPDEWRVCCQRACLCVQVRQILASLMICGIMCRIAWEYRIS